MPSVRTESQPMNAAQTVAMAMATGTASHQGQPRLMAASELAAAPKIATM
jgi:hypothetical protein